MAQITGLPEWFKEAKGAPCHTGDARDKTGAPFPCLQSAGTSLEKTLGNIASALMRLLDSEECAARPGLLQGIDPAARIAGVLAMTLAAAITKNPAMLAGIMLLTAALALLSRVPPLTLAKRVSPAFVFTAVLALPVFFTAHGGFYAGAFIIARVTAMTALTALMLLTTRLSGFFTGLRRLRAPRFFVTALFMTLRYIFILLKMAEDAALAKKSRLINRAGLRESQRWFASRVALFLKKSLSLSEEVTGAMVSRGFNGHIKTFGGERFKPPDYAWLFAASFVFFLSLGL